MRHPRLHASLHGPPTRCFDSTRGNLAGEFYVERTLAKLEAVTRACAEAGPLKTRGAAAATAAQVAGLSVGLRHLDHLGPG